MDFKRLNPWNWLKQHRQRLILGMANREGMCHGSSRTVSFSGFSVKGCCRTGVVSQTPPVLPDSLPAG